MFFRCIAAILGKETALVGRSAPVGQLGFVDSVAQIACAVDVFPQLSHMGVRPVCHVPLRNLCRHMPVRCAAA